MKIDLTFLILIFSTALYAQTYNYPRENSEIQLTFPENWSVVYQDHFLDCRSEKDSTQLILLRFGEGYSPDTAQVFMNAFLKENTQNLSFDKSEKMVMNNITFSSRLGKAKFNMNNEVIIKTLVFRPLQGLCYGIIYFFSEENSSLAETSLKEILFSISTKSGFSE